MSPILRAESANQLGRVGGREGTGSRDHHQQRSPGIHMLAAMLKQRGVGGVLASKLSLGASLVAQ